MKIPASVLARLAASNGRRGSPRRIKRRLAFPSRLCAWEGQRIDPPASECARALFRAARGSAAHWPGSIAMPAMLPHNSLAAPPTSAGCRPSAIRSASIGFCPPCAAKKPPSTATPRVAPTIRAVLTMPAATPVLSFGAAARPTESNGPVFRPKPMPICRKANSIRTTSIPRESVDRMRNPNPIRAKPEVMTTRAPNLAASAPDLSDTRRSNACAMGARSASQRPVTAV